MKKWLTLLPDPLIAVILGIALTFAFAPYGVFPLAILTMTGLLALWLKAETSPKKAFWLGFAFGLGLFGVGVYWVFISIHVVADVNSFLAAIITIGMIAFLSLYPAIAGYFTKRYFNQDKTAKIVYAFPAIWLFTEWVRGFLFTGFPWLFLGYSQTNSPLKGYAPIFSVYGVSLAVLLSSGLLLNTIYQFRQQQYRAAYQHLLLLLLIFVIGGLTSLIPWTETQGKPLTVALVQGNIKQTLKWSPEHLQLSLDRYTELTQPLWGKYDLIIWPEAAIPLPLQNAEGFVNALNDKAKETHSVLIFGIPIQVPGLGVYYNAVALLPREINPNGNVYLKRRLVPFGEYTPFSPYLTNIFNFMQIPMSDMISGNFQQPPLQMDHIKILTSICYEIAFPNLIRTIDASPSLLLTVTNDAWFGHSNAQAQHLQMAAMRAEELGRPLLFVSNDGITAIIGPNGDIQSTLPKRKAAVLTGNIQPMSGVTPWMYNGSDPILFLCICLLVLAYFSNRKTKTLETTDSMIK